MATPSTPSLLLPACFSFFFVFLFDVWFSPKVFSVEVVILIGEWRITIIEYCGKDGMCLTLQPKRSIFFMVRKKIVLSVMTVVALWGGGMPLGAQTQDSVCLKPVCGLEYAGELQTNFRGGHGFVNLLGLNAEIPLGRSLTLSVSTVSSAKSSEERLADDVQVFSNLEADNLPLALCVAGMGWRIGERHSLFAGIRNMNVDYFTSDVTSLFTHSSNGIFPTVASNYDIANYPVASVGVHYMYETDPLTLQASLYNGRGYKRFSGRENVFRFCPESDGVFAVAQAEYKYHDSHYFLGTSFHYGRLDGGARQVRPSFWTYAEQRVASDLSLMVAYSHDFQPSSLCRNFVGLGGKMDVGKAEVGLFSDYTRIEGVDEWATELTCR